MSTLILLAFLVGAVLGLRYKVLILAPAMGLAILAVIATSLAHHYSLPTTLIAGVLALTCVQIGYLGGILTRYAMILTRGGSQRNASVQAESVR
jgi:4-amino-4-deoxy-L-arabinose transferase-like glycosyltransferase